MKRFFTAVLLLSCLAPFARAADKLTTVLIHPQETVYARFDESGKKLKLVSISKEPDAQAQVIFTLQPENGKPLLKLTVQNKFTRDLTYRVEMRSLTAKRQMPVRVTPVVAGKLAFENFPNLVEEIAAFDFKLMK